MRESKDLVACCGLMEEIVLGTRKKLQTILFLFSQDLDYLELVGIEPYLFAGEAFVNRNDVLVGVGPREHSRTAIRAINTGRSSGDCLCGQEGILHESSFEILGLLY